MAPEDKAVVVFVRRRYLGKAMDSFVLDENLRYITATRGKTHAKVLMRPGCHSVFVFFIKDGWWLDLDLEAGRTYVIRTRPVGFHRTLLEIYLATRGQETFDEAKGWLAETKLHRPDPAKMKGKLQKKRWRKRQAAALVRGTERRDRIEDYSERFGLRPEDGRTREEAIELATSD